MLRVDVAGPGAAGLVRALRVLDTRGLARIEEHAAVRAVAFRVVVAGAEAGNADVVVAPGAAGQRAARLWTRLEPWAAALAGSPVPSHPPVIRDYDARWPTLAQVRLERLRCALAPLGEFDYQHIGSTSVPGLGAKPILDLQIRMPRIPGPDELDAGVRAVGFLPAHGSRPDSPGVHRDMPRGGEPVPDEVWAKRLFHAPDPELPSVLHVRRADSPFGRHTVWFRDWLRAHPAERDRYVAVKRELARRHGGDADFDDYTRAKTAYFDGVHDRFARWVADRVEQGG